MPIGEPFVELFEVDSTNNYAMGQAQAALAGHGAAWFAHSQTAGKGQRGRSWVSEAGQNIMLSILLNPEPLNLSEQFTLSAAVAVACRTFLDKYTNGDVTIKWPNDLYWRDRKAGGILIENIVQGSTWRFAVAGIGININQKYFDAALANPVSLSQITGKSFDTVALAKELCQNIHQQWQMTIDGNRGQVLSAYRNNLYKLSEVATFQVENATFSALVKGVNAKGELLIDTGEETVLPIGAARWVIS